MGFFKKLFGSAPAEEEKIAEPVQEDEQEGLQYEFETLRDDGVRALRMTAYGRAETYLRSALERKDDPQVRSLLAEVYLRSGRGGEAAEILKQLVDEQPDDQRLWQALAWAADMTADAGTLLSAGNKLQELCPELPNGAYYIARSHIINKEYIAAVETLSSVLNQHADHAETLLLRAQALAALECYDEAEADVDRLMDMERRGEDVLTLKARLRQAQGDNAGAEKAYLELREADPFNLRAMQLLTDLYLSTSQAEKALAMLNEAIDWQPEEPVGYALRSRVYEAMGNGEAAAEDKAKAQELEPEADAAPCDKQRMRDQLNDEARQRNPFGF